MLDPTRMASIVAAVDIGKPLEKARAQGLVTTKEEEDFWVRTEREIAEIRRQGGSVSGSVANSWD